MKKHTPNKSRGFTLVELLTVVAIIGILAGILIPVVGGAKKNALKAKTKAQFSGWATALEAYKNEYGHYPKIGSLATEGELVLDGGSKSQDFMKALSGRDPSTGERDTSENRKAIGFYSFGDSELQEGTDYVLVDAFGNPNIHIKVDANGDGIVDISNAPDDVDGDDLKTRVAIWVDEADGEDYETVTNW
ncbi:type II secretion system protein [Cerasicoccus maritimus]|uniref:type II secretion system protein n=1 Tax=Cerasicoccus maritimus TaxID=490089 RepID=UPI0028528A41|nr:prepilin-type N-terminal cleavage/methylation domain-containing protein [Cerasicoccus maritimus]